MLHISWRSEYALLFLAALSKCQSGDYLSLRTLARRQGLPYRFLSQIAAQLKKGGLVGSKEGNKGGYYLLKQPQHITLSEVIGLSDSYVGLVGCQRGEGCKNEAGCEIKHAWQLIQTEVDVILKKHSLADLLKHSA